MKNGARSNKPTIGILTNIGSSHDEGFSNLEQK
jgi:alanine racemase